MLASAMEVSAIEEASESVCCVFERAMAGVGRHGLAKYFAEWKRTRLMRAEAEEPWTFGKSWIYAMQNAPLDRKVVKVIKNMKRAREKIW